MYCMQKPVIDVSAHNGVLNWELIASQIDGAILRCGYGRDEVGQDDEQFERNARECERLGIPYGVYLFSYARNIEDALSEAHHVLRLVNNKNMQLPIYYDIEYSDYQGDLSAKQYTANAVAFCQEIIRHGGFVGIYANTFFFREKLYSPAIDEYAKWIARYASEAEFNREYQLWQYTDEGKIDGSSEYTDLNRYYGDFLTMAGKDNYFRDRQKMPRSIIKIRI